MPLFVLFLAVPIVEIALFIQVGGLIGLFPTLAIVVLTAILGTWMIRAQGLREIANLRASFNELRDPTEPLAHGAMILVAGALLLTPGFFTDALGFLLLLPPFRRVALAWAKSRVSFQTFDMASGNGSARAPVAGRGSGPGAPRSGNAGPMPAGDVIETDYEEIGNSDAPGASGWTKH